MDFFSADALCTAYSGKEVLNGVSFSLAPGTLTGLLGTNGSGKTTLLKSICSLLPHRGVCLLRGEALERLSARERARRISYLPQKSSLSISLSVLDVVLMGFHAVLGLFASPSKRQKQAALDALARVGLADAAGRDYQTLSEGQKQLCLLARTLIEDTALLLLDEPDSALDFPNRCRILQTLSEMVTGQERAALLILHDPALALDFCDRLLLLKDGRLFASLSPRRDSPKRMEALLSEVFGAVSVHLVCGRNGQPHPVMLSETVFSRKEVL